MTQEIYNMVEAQVKAACLGVNQSVKDLQASTGIKDGYTQYWVEILLQHLRKVRTDNPALTISQIQDELMQWVHNNND